MADGAPDATAYLPSVVGSTGGAVAGGVLGWIVASVVVGDDPVAGPNVALMAAAMAVVVAALLACSLVGCYVALRAVGAPRSGATTAWMALILALGLVLLFTGVAPLAAITVGPLLARRLALRRP